MRTLHSYFPHAPESRLLQNFFVADFDEKLFFRIHYGYPRLHVHGVQGPRDCDSLTGPAVSLILSEVFLSLPHDLLMQYLHVPLLLCDLRTQEIVIVRVHRCLWGRDR